MNLLTPTLNQVRRSRHLHIRCFQRPAPALGVPCSPMPVVTRVNQVAAYQVCRHPASLCSPDHVLHAICPNAMTLAFYSRGE